LLNPHLKPFNVTVAANVTVIANVVANVVANATVVANVVCVYVCVRVCMCVANAVANCANLTLLYAYGDVCIYIHTLEEHFKEVAPLKHFANK
jgi:hypothetical protein